MPRVTIEHSEARRQQILDAAHACFLRDGFHQTSMQDIQREAGLSAGAIYLYFKSKSEIILGIALRILDTVSGVIPEGPPAGRRPPTLADLLRVFLNQAERLERERPIFPIAIQVWGEAIRDPAMLASLRASLDKVKLRVQHVIELCQAGGTVRADADPAALSLAIIGLGQGFIVQRTLLDERVLDQYVAGVEALLANATGLPGTLGPDPARGPDEPA